MRDMLTKEEFINRYKVELELCTESEVNSYYIMYLEDPFEFSSGMIG